MSSRALRKVEGLLKQPVGDASKQVRLDPTLLGDLRTVLEFRNRLAHDFLVRFRVEYAVREEAVGLAVAFLDGARVFMDDVQQRLDEIADERLFQRGIEEPYLDDDEMNDLMESLRCWTRDETEK